MEDYKEKYKQALERAKNYHKGHTLDVNPQAAMEYVFPELKECENERIRKAIIKMVSDIAGGFPFEKYGIQKKEALAWLEKQGEKKLIDKIQLGKKYKCIASPRYSTFMIGEIYKPEDKFLCSLMNFCSDCFEPIEDGEQNYTNKVEPKFKVGDWVVPNNGEPRAFRVEERGWPDSIISGSLGNQSVNTFTLDKQYHLWTIQDAKEGDVLADDYGIYIFEKFDECDKDGFVCIGAYQYSQKVYECGHMLCYTDVHPADQGQRDLLFSKMKEAGYEWNKELVGCCRM